jgi:hypothetical protein
LFGSSLKVLSWLQDVINREGKSKLTYNEALLLITSPHHRLKVLFMDKKVDYFIYVQEGCMLWEIVLDSRTNQKATSLQDLLLLPVSDWSIIMIRPGSLLLVSSLPPNCNRSFSFISGVGKK